MSAKRVWAKSPKFHLRAVVRLAATLNRGTLAPFLWAQRFFYSTDLGDGYVASATAS